MHPGSLPAPNPTPDLAVRDIFMHELTDASGRVFEAFLNDKHFSDPIVINPTLGTAEIWRYINTNRNVHTMHMHLVSFQVLDRQPFDVEHYIRTKELVFTGPPVEPDAQEFGRRDMVNCPAGIVTRVLTSPFNRLGRYLYDCANLGLEENEWMRPFEVVEAQPGGGAGSGFVALEPTSYL